MIATSDFRSGIAIGMGVFAAYVVHVIGSTARFDPDWTKKVEAVDESVEQEVESTGGESV